MCPKKYPRKVKPELIPNPLTGAEGKQESEIDKRTTFPPGRKGWEQ